MMSEKQAAGKQSSSSGKRSKDPSTVKRSSNLPFIARDEDLPAKPTGAGRMNEGSFIGLHQNLMPRRGRRPSSVSSFHSSEDESSFEDDAGGVGGDDNDAEIEDHRGIDEEDEDDPFGALQQLLEHQTLPPPASTASQPQQHEQRVAREEPKASTSSVKNSVISSQQNPTANRSATKGTHGPSLLRQVGGWRQPAMPHANNLPNAESQSIAGRCDENKNRSVHWSARALLGGGSAGRLLHLHETPKRMSETNNCATTPKALPSVSIVGSRPEHWVAKTPTSTNSRKLVHHTSSKPNRSQDAAATRISKLAEATKKRRFLLLGPTSIVSPPKRGPATSQTQDGTEMESSTTACVFDTSRANHDFDTTQMGDLLTPRPPGYGNQLAMAESITGNSSGSAGCTPASGDQLKRRRSTKRIKAHGPLMSRLVALRREDDADCVRLRSSTYSTTNQLTSLNDPRKHAMSIMDVTIAGDPLVWDVAEELLVVLGYVHSHVHTNDAIKPDQSAGAAQNFAMMYFTFETGRQQRLRRGLQLRLYNAVVIPSRHYLATSDSAGRGETEVLRPTASVICTRLCEPYPASLPALPALPGLTDNAGGAAALESCGIPTPWECHGEDILCDERFV